MKRLFKIGDHVKWNSEAGYVSGKIIEIHAGDFDYKGYTHHASKRSSIRYKKRQDYKTNHVAVHKGKALTKLSR